MKQEREEEKDKKTKNKSKNLPTTKQTKRPKDN